MALAVLGNMIYWDGAGWRVLKNQGAPSVNPTVSVGQEFIFIVQWVNGAPSVPVRGHVDVAVTRPDGVTVPAEYRPDVVPGWGYRQDTVLYEGSSASLPFAFTPGIPGQYQVRVTLVDIS